MAKTSCCASNSVKRLVESEDSSETTTHSWRRAGPPRDPRHSESLQWKGHGIVGPVPSMNLMALWVNRGRTEDHGGPSDPHVQPSLSDGLWGRYR